MSQRIYVTEKEVSEMPNSKKQIMTPLHPRWGEFIERLSGTEGCDFKYDDNKANGVLFCNWFIGHRKFKNNKPFQKEVIMIIEESKLKASKEYLQEMPVDVVRYSSQDIRIIRLCFIFLVLKEVYNEQHWFNSRFCKS